MLSKISTNPNKSFGDRKRIETRVHPHHYLLRSFRPPSSVSKGRDSGIPHWNTADASARAQLTKTAVSWNLHETTVE